MTEIAQTWPARRVLGLPAEPQDGGPELGRAIAHGTRGGPGPGSACAVSLIVSSHLLAAYGMSLDDREEAGS
jgi:hypothetical protein